MKRQHTPAQAGFTLIEMLVVVAIIAVLAGLVLTSVGGARIKARDVARKATLNQLRNALELYYNDFGSYPSTQTLVSPIGCASGGYWHSSEVGDSAYTNGIYIPGLANYVQKLPIDPLGGNSTICAAGWKRGYLYCSNGTSYKLLSHCAAEGAVTSADAFYDPVPANQAYRWMVCSGATACNTW